MSKCNIDHSKDDVKSKFESQKAYLPAEIRSLFHSFFQMDHSQEVLNEVFHLLKKYDLVSKDEQDQRNISLKMQLNHK